MAEKDSRRLETLVLWPAINVFLKWEHLFFFCDFTQTDRMMKCIRILSSASIFLGLSTRRCLTKLLTWDRFARGNFEIRGSWLPPNNNHLDIWIIVWFILWGSIMIFLLSINYHSTLGHDDVNLFGNVFPSFVSLTLKSKRKICRTPGDWI